MNDRTPPQQTAADHPAPAPTRRHGVYYGSTPYYGGAAPGQPGLPAYYGGNPYGPSSYYGPGYGYGGGGPGDDSDSLLGAVTIGRMIRVCTQRWMTIAVIAVLGAVGAFAVYRIMPSMYLASSTFEMLLSKPRITRSASPILGEEGGSDQEQVFNTRLAKLHSWDAIQEVLRHFRADNPSNIATDQDLLDTLVERTDLALIRRTHLIRIDVRSTNPELASALANAYAATVESFTQEENRQQCEAAVAWLKTTVAGQRRALERSERAILDFRTSNQIDVMENERKSAEAAQQTLNADVVTLETQINHAQDLVKALGALQGDPDKFGALPEATPRSAELLAAYQQLERAFTEKNVLLTRFTASHPDVIAKEKEIELLRSQFGDVVMRTRETAKANLDLLSSQMDNATRRRDAMAKRISELEYKIVNAKMQLEALIREREVADMSFRDILHRENEARMAYDENLAAIRLVQKASVPKKPVSPNPFVILPAGPIAGVLVGILFVLLLDHLEDKITGIPDIETRIRVKVLAVLPHIRRARREQVALLSVEDRFSHFAEAFAGLRNLMDSPRYANVSRVLLVVSTQPSEGKTISSSNFALSCALSGQRTLLVDGDLRRPRVARIYGKNRKDFQNLAQVLAANDPSLFPSLPVPSGHANLDLVCARSSSEIIPSNLLGSGAVAQFIDWARQNYDRVIIDSPPFGLVSDAVVLSTLADGVILMCCPDRTRFRPLKHAVRHLSEAGGHILGVLVNDVDFGRSGMFSRYDYHYHYSYRYKYGYKYGYGQRAAGSAEAATPSGPDEETAGPEQAPPRVAAPASQAAQPASVEDDDE